MRVQKLGLLLVFLQLQQSIYVSCLLHAYQLGEGVSVLGRTHNLPEAWICGLSCSSMSFNGFLDQ